MFYGGMILSLEMIIHPRARDTLPAPIGDCDYVLHHTKSYRFNFSVENIDHNNIAICPFRR
jgi:hypothetical protein